MRSVFLLTMSLCLAGFCAACSRQYCPVVCYGNGADVVKQDFVHKYGMEVQEKEWNSRGKSGKIVTTLKNGVIATTNYLDGYLEGEATYTFPHSGAIQKVETYAGGQLVAEQEMYPSGSRKKQVQHLRPDCKILSAWYENNSPRYREVYQEDRLIEADYYTLNQQVESRIDDGKGFRINRDDFGQLISKDKFNEGQCVLITTFYPNGAPKEVTPKRDGKTNGRRKTFLPGGEPRTDEEWSDGRQEGTTIVYQNGEKIAEVPYFAGLKNGIEDRFKDGRFIVEKVTWKNGKKHGPTYLYNGEDTLTLWYYEGQEVGKRQYDRLINPHPY